MTRAAKQLGITQSAVSQTVKLLEAEFRTVLFDRDVRPARATRAGDILRDMAQSLLSDARQLAQVMRQTAHRDVALIRLGCVDSFAATLGPWLVRALSGTARQLQMLSGLTPGLNTQLSAREIDLAVCTEVPLGGAQIAPRLLFSESWVAIFPKDAKVGPLAVASDLRSIGEGLPLIRYSQRSVIGQQIERFLQHVGVKAPQRFEFDASDPLLALVAAGIGWSITTPLCLWQSRAWVEQVQIVPIPRARLGQREFFLMCRDAEWSTLADEIVDLTRTVLADQLIPMLAAKMDLPPDAISIPTSHSSN